MRHTFLFAFFALLLGCTDRAAVGDLAPERKPPAADGVEEEGTDEPPPAEEEAPKEFRVPKVKTPIAASIYTTCAVASNGHVLCWGDNSSSQLGFRDISHGSSAVPVAPKDLPATAFAVARGRYGQCALLENEQPRCWGDVGFGLAEDTGEQLLTQIDEPTPIGPLAADIANVSYGAGFGCALNTAGRVKCWGIGSSGALGSGTTADDGNPRQIAGITEPLVDLSASSNGRFACVVGVSGVVYCWGYNATRELGHGDATPFDATPKAVVGIPEKAKNVVSGRTHACALLESGRVSCWGDDAEGQLGSGAKGAPSAPRLVAGIEGATSIFVGLVHTCAIMKDHEVLCWGVDDQGQITGVMNAPSPLKPTRLVPASFGATAGTAGVSHTCVITDGRHVRCIGRSDRSRLGPGDFTLP